MGALSSDYIQKQIKEMACQETQSALPQYIENTSTGSAHRSRGWKVNTDRKDGFSRIKYPARLTIREQMIHSNSQTASMSVDPNTKL